jgi:hypothetical protein
MKLLTIIFCLVLSVNALAQSKSDSLKHLNESVVYVVDGILMSKEQIKSNDILSKDVLKGASLDRFMSILHSEKILDSVIIISTKQGAIKSYQKKFSAFSKEYKQYIDANKGDDHFCNYIVDDKVIYKDQGDFLTTLYNIPAEKIVTVIAKGPRPIDSFIGLKVWITTKK